jgi:hypothetical protein
MCKPAYQCISFPPAGMKNSQPNLAFLMAERFSKHGFWKMEE